MQDGLSGCSIFGELARVALTVMCAYCRRMLQLLRYAVPCRTSPDLNAGQALSCLSNRAGGQRHTQVGAALEQVRGDGETMPPRAPPGAEDGLDCSIRSGAETCTIKCVASAAPYYVGPV